MIGPSATANFVPRLRAIEQIIYAVAEVYGCAPAEIMGRARSKTIAEARLCVCVVARRCTRMSLTEIGDSLDRDHTTVMAALASGKRQAARDPHFAGVVAELCKQFEEEAGAATQ